MKTLAELIRSKTFISESTLEVILSKFKEKTISKGSLLLKKGQIATKYYYLASGSLRFFYLNENSSQFTAWVIFAGEFFTELSSLNPQLPTRFNIEAIEDTTVYYIEMSDMEMLYGQYPEWQKFNKKPSYWPN